LQADLPPGPKRPDPREEIPGIRAIGPDPPQPRPLVPEDPQQRLGPIPVWHTGGRHHDGQQQA
ncbi:MAG: hypothetical protein M3255_09040, partial [Pseudomonadota bacterium]|nr:hypothetical protein [Pseudomonadota bacterium]